MYVERNHIFYETLINFYETARFKKKKKMKQFGIPMNKLFVKPFLKNTKNKNKNQAIVDSNEVRFNQLNCLPAKK